MTSRGGQAPPRNTYDAMGNPTSYLGKTLTWEGKQLIAASIPRPGVNKPVAVSYAYDENGLRLEKTVAGTKTEYYYNGSLLIGMKLGTGSSAKLLRFSYDASGNVVAVDYSTDNGSNFTTYYYLRNAQNDIVKIVDSSGTTVVQYIYDSWGKLLSVTGTLAAALGTDQPFRYRGYVYDEETQWYYLQSRYYDPATCRFISADVLLSTGQGVIGYNSFAYCNNNPTNYTDEEGTIPFATLFGILVHRAIQDYMIENEICGVNWYKNVVVDHNRFGVPSWGFVDLVDEKGGAYEIKPANNPFQFYFGIGQLYIYTESSIIDKRQFDFGKLSSGKLLFSGQVAVCGKLVQFDCTGDGLILYYEVENTGEGLVPVYDEVPVPHRVYNRNSQRTGSLGAAVVTCAFVGIAVGIALGGTMWNDRTQEAR